MEFKEFKKIQQKHITEMLKDVDHLFVVDIDRDEFWELYLDSFPEGTNPIFRERREFDCSCCRSFVKSFGNVVTLKDNVMTTIWGFQIDDFTYAPVVQALDKYIKSRAVTDVFCTKELVFGTDRNFEETTDQGVITWEHFYYKLPSKFQTQLSYGDTLPTIQGRLRDVRNVFKRSLDEISPEAVDTVLELIAQNSLYKGEEWQAVLKQFQKIQKEYSKLNPEFQERDDFCWEQSVKVGPVIGKIRNHSIGTLLINISEGMELDQAVKMYESIVAPSNYKRPKAIFTKKMLEDAQKQLEELGYMDSIGRRFATIEDITVNNILFANKDSISKMSGNVFDEMKKEITSSPKKFDKVEEVGIDKFIKDILPTTSKLEVLFDSQHISNMVSLIAPENKDCKTMFKWDNNFSWAYNGNITDSMKDRVKEFGGKVDGVLRFSIQWNTENDNNNDFDAHCIEPTGNHIYYGNKGQKHSSSGVLDVDIQRPMTQTKDGVAVENITWSSKSKMPKGTYKFYVNNYSHNGGRSGFTAEIEFDGQIHSFTYNKELRQGERVDVAEIIFKDSKFELKEKLPSSTSSKKVWNIDTHQFHPVSVMMYSPNYWDEQKGIGNKHYFFMLKDCINDESPNGFFNEYLNEELMKHKRVFEALGSKMRVKDADNQLSGLGFSSTQRNSLICKVEGSTSRMLKINF